jgi:Tol biopolymer transport system component
MGEVYRARDTRLGRDVAIKVLPAAASSDPERRRRFEQEARAASALSHPNICVLHDIGSTSSPQAAGGATIDFLVMELLEGETLAHRLRKRPLPLAQALDLGAQIADGLAAAHKRGIVHRDLKPANVMLTKSGAGLQAKLLDFGLAKLKAQPVPAAGEMSALTTEGPATTPGAVLGTVPYMAPEQLEGKDADARTDLFAFGCVLYEVLAGRRAFAGETEASIISSIMTSEPPPISSVQPVTPPALERLVKACLAKDPDARRQSAHDVAEELRGITEGAGMRAPTASPTARRRGWILAAGALLLAITAGALAVRGGWWRPRPVPARSDIAMPEGTQFHRLYVELAFAPDGSALVFRAGSGSGARLYWQSLDGSPPRAIPGAEDGWAPFFSPDGKHLAFAQRGRLVKLALPSGQPDEASHVEPIAKVGLMRGASWGEVGGILYCPGAGQGLWRVSAQTGQTHEVTRLDPARHEQSHRWPSFLPRGRAALFTVLDASGRIDRSAIALLNIQTGRWARIIERGTCARYLPSGHIVYARNGALLAVRFDLGTLETLGDPVPVASGIQMARGGGAGDASFAVSPSGSLAFAPENPLPARSSLLWIDREGKTDPVVDEQQAYAGNLDLSRDGQKLAVSIMGQDYENLAVYHLRERRWQYFPAEAEEMSPIWSPNGDRLAFASNRDGPFNLYVTWPSEEGRTERLTQSGNWQIPFSWSPDGRFLAYQQQDDFGWNIWIRPFDGDGKPRRWGPVQKGASLPAFSPLDGRWLAYQSEEAAGTMDVYLQPFPGPGSRQTVSGAGGGVGPVWTPDGRELLYLPGSATDNRIMAVDVFPGPPLKLGNPHVAFALPFAPSGTNPYFRRVFALTPDGRRLVVVRRDSTAPAEIHKLTLVRNWAEEVKAKLAEK